MSSFGASRVSRLGNFILRVVGSSWFISLYNGNLLVPTSELVIEVNWTYYNIIHVLCLIFHKGSYKMGTRHVKSIQNTLINVDNSNMSDLSWTPPSTSTSLTWWSQTCQDFCWCQTWPTNITVDVKTCKTLKGFSLLSIVHLLQWVHGYNNNNVNEGVQEESDMSWTHLYGSFIKNMYK